MIVVESYRLLGYVSQVRDQEAYMTNLCAFLDLSAVLDLSFFLIVRDLVLVNQIFQEERLGHTVCSAP